MEDVVGDVDDQSLREELESCKHFLTDTEMENGRHRVFNFAMSSFDISLLNDKLDYVFNELKFAAKVNLAFAFVLKNIEDGMCRYFYAHENNTILEKSKLACTPDDIDNMEEKLQKMDIVDLCTRERANTKWKYYKLTTVTPFAALFKGIPMVVKIQSYLNHFWETVMLFALLLREIRLNPTMTVFASSEQLLCIYLKTRDWRRRHPESSTFS